MTIAINTFAVVGCLVFLVAFWYEFKHHDDRTSWRILFVISSLEVIFTSYNGSDFSLIFWTIWAVVSWMKLRLFRRTDLLEQELQELLEEGKRESEG